MQKIERNLTIILPLKGRLDFFKRYLEYFRLFGISYNLLIADGSLDDSLQEFFYGSVFLSQENIKYIRYPADDALSNFYKKMCEIICYVDTPYVMLNDNDDFFIPSGIDLSLKFLIQNESFSACSGAVGAFSTEGDKPYGCLKRMYEFDNIFGRPVPFESCNPIENIVKTYDNLKPFYLYYMIFRRDKLKTILTEVFELNPNDLEIHERYIMMRSVSMGPVKIFKHYYTYLRQKNVSMNNLYIPWHRRVLLKNWMLEFDKSIKFLIKNIYNLRPEDLKVNYVNIKEIEGQIKTTIANYKRQVFDTDFYSYIPIRSKIRNIDCIVDAIFFKFKFISKFSIVRLGIFRIFLLYVFGIKNKNDSYKESNIKQKMDFHSVYNFIKGV